MINVALAKGRLGSKIAQVLGILVDESSRRLVFQDGNLRLFWVKPFDVPIYVERGVADAGFCGRDILLERKPNVYELLNLNIGRCKMCVCAKEDFVDDGVKALRVATEFPVIARDYYVDREVDVITLRGSLELAPILGLSDVIVDIVETGSTLRANGLKVIAEVADLSARLIANKSAYKFKKNEIDDLIGRVKEWSTK